ncbi:MAG: response regulator transcription factor [Chloroflexia bacterium]|nr:response regulator transcription factor [Chloroflexia bacterium]
MDAQTHILVVDDEPGIRFFLEEVLTRDGHRVTAVESGEAALEQIERQTFDLALLDLKMKGIGGIKVLAVIREKSPETAVIVLTAHASLESAVEALRHGAHDYLFKPCKTMQIRESVRTGLLRGRKEQERQRLLAELQQHLSDEQDLPRQDQPVPSVAIPPEGQERFLRQGGLIVDLMRHVATLDGQLLEFSPTEFDLLAYMVSEAPRVISPQELVREVQGYESEPWEARDTIRYHIYRLRRKIKKAAGRSDLIRNVRGVGYTVDNS